MRQIEKAMCRAIALGQTRSMGNTNVQTIGSVSYVRLHGNLIAEIGRDSDTIRLTLAGWPTPTTRSRLNALCSAFTNGARFYQYRHQQMFSAGYGPGVEHEIGARDWVEVPLYGQFNADTRAALKRHHDAQAAYERANPPKNLGMQGQGGEQG